MNRIRSLLCLLPLLGGCQALFFTVSDRKQSVPAEYRRIGNQRVAVVVWAEQATLDMDSFARHRVCQAVTYYMKQNLTQARFAEPTAISRLQESSGLDWESMAPRELAQELDCDLILRIDLLQYTTRSPEARELRKGTIEATVNLFSSTDDSTSEPLYTTTVSAVYPPDSSIGVLDRSDQQILTDTVEQFGQMVAKKFYDHEVPYTKTHPR